jgi:hypothetical protein
MTNSGCQARSEGDDLSFCRALLSARPEALDRFRHGREYPLAGPQSYLDYKRRTGVTHLPFDVALNLEHRFCGAGPATVLVGVESTERKRLSRNSNGWFEMPQILLDSEAARLRRAISKG